MNKVMVMNLRNYGFVIFTIVIFLSGFTTLASAEETLVIEEYVEPDYFFPVDLTSIDGVDYEWTITSDRSIDFIFLTFDEFEDCCSGDEAENINSDDIRNKYSKQTHNFVLQSEKSNVIIVLDNSEAVPGGASPSGTVLIKIYAEEHYEYSFQLLGFIFGSLLLIVILFGTYVGIGKNNMLLKIEQNQTYIPELKSKITNYLDNKQNTFYGKYPMLTFLMSVNIIAFILAVVMGTNIDGATVEQGLNMGATSVNEVIEGDLFSLIASNFMHWDWQHLLFNMLSFYFLGRYVEEELGSFRFFWFAMFTGVCSALFGLLGWAVVGGASGIAFALIGIIFSQIVIGRYKKIDSYCRYPDMSYYWYVFIANIALIPFVSQEGIAVYAHIGGFTSGFAVGLYLFHAGRPNTSAEILNEKQINLFIDITEENKITLENYEKLPLGGRYVYFQDKVAYLTRENYLYVKHQDDNFTLEKWMPEEE